MMLSGKMLKVQFTEDRSGCHGVNLKTVDDFGVKVARAAGI
jgi:hypothetical protein